MQSKPFVPGQPPPWMLVAREMIGQRETPGPETSGAIANMLSKLHAWWHDDETPWCGTLLAYCMAESELAIPSAWYRARAWASWGRPLRLGGFLSPIGAQQAGAIPYGAVVVLERGSAGHVTTYVAPVRARPTMFWGLGGNQGDMVKVSAFDCSRILAVRWPADYPYTDYRGADVTAIASGEHSESEA